MTNFSFLRGASHPEEMVARAAELGLAGIGIADRNTLAGVVRAHVFARENAAAMGGMRVVPGARLVFSDGAPDLLAYPKDRAAYGRLCRLLTAGNLRAPKGECWLKLDDLLEHGEGLQIVALPPSSGPSGAAFSRKREKGVAPSPACGRGGEGTLARLREAFGQRLWIGASLTYGEDMRGALARRMGARARGSRAADRHQRRADACARAARARRRPRLHPRENDARGRGAPHAGQRRAASERPARNGAAVRRGAGRRSRRRSASSTASTSASTNFAISIRRSCAKAMRRRRPRWKPSRKPGARARYPEGVPERRARRSRMSSSSSPRSTTRLISSPCTTSCASRARAASSARAAARRPIPPSASASGSPRSIRRASIFCSSASSRPSATSRPTSTSISSTSGARR